MAIDGLPGRFGAHRQGATGLTSPRPLSAVQRPAWRVTTFFAALAMASASLVSAPASACGYHSAADIALGMLNWTYPRSLHVRTAVWQAENAGVLPPRRTAPAKDLFAFNRVIRDIGAFGAGLKAGPQPEGAANFSLVLVDSMLWTNFTAGDVGYEVRTHVEGPANDDVVVVTHSKVLAAMLDGQIDTSSAESFGLIRLYGKAERVERILRTLETRAAGLDAAGAATRLTGLPE